jgi:(p)ppGpp synthase/HD superfamily hydrolase
MQETLQVLKAADVAARWHVHQRRKGFAKEPYVNHLLEVALLVADATGSKDTNLMRSLLAFSLCSSLPKRSYGLVSARRVRSRS